MILLFVLVGRKIKVSTVLSDSIVHFMKKLSLDIFNHLNSFAKIYWDFFVKFFSFLKKNFHVLLRLLSPSVHFIQLRKCATVKHFIWYVLLMSKNSELFKERTRFLALLLSWDFSLLVFVYQSKNMFGVSLLVLQKHINIVR